MAGLVHSQPAVVGRLGLVHPGVDRLSRLPVPQAPLRSRLALQRSPPHQLGARTQKRDRRALCLRSVEKLVLCLEGLLRV